MTAVCWMPLKKMVYHLVPAQGWTPTRVSGEPLCGDIEPQSVSIQINGAAYCRHCKQLEGEPDVIYANRGSD